jgi:enoyl-CoA hydratase/carnithine racemase
VADAKWSKGKLDVGDKLTFAIEHDVGIISLNDAPMNLASTGNTLLASSCRATVIAAAGPQCSGSANVSIFRGRSAADAHRIFKTYLPIVQKLETAPFPIVVAFQGFCLAAGLELALACDMIFAAQVRDFRRWTPSLARRPSLEARSVWRRGVAMLVRGR